MKKISFVLFVLFSLKTYGQDKKLTISTNLANLVFLGPSLAINYQASSQLGFQIYGSTGHSNIIDVYKFKTLIFDVRRSILPEFFQGVYVGPYVRYIEKQVVKEGYSDRTGFFSYLNERSRDFHGKGLSAGLLVGAKLIDAHSINVEAFCGGGYGKFISQRDYSGDSPRNGFLDARFGVLVGLKL
jgi:hypothetical protein